MFSNAAKFTWGYNWNAHLDQSYLPSGQEYVPMCWGENLALPGRSWQDCKDGLQKTFARNPGTKHILG